MAGIALARRALLPFVGAALAAGAAATALGHASLGRVVWQSATVVVTAGLVLVTLERLRRGRIAVDLVALLALGGSLRRRCAGTFGPAGGRRRSRR